MSGRVTKPIVVLLLAFHIMNCKAFKKVKNFIVTGRLCIAKRSGIEMTNCLESCYLYMQLALKNHSKTNTQT